MLLTKKKKEEVQTMRMLYAEHQGTTSHSYDDTMMEDCTVVRGAEGCLKKLS